MDKIVSVIMPSFNREKTLPRAIASVQNQTLTNWELIIIDDGSTDNTKELVEHFTKKDSRIKYITNTRKKGPAGARNTGILASQGEYIAFLDDDDEWSDNHLKDCLKILNEEDVPIVTALFHKVIDGQIAEVNFEERLERAYSYLKPAIKNNAVFFTEDFLEHDILKVCFCYHMGTMVLRKYLLESTGLMDEDIQSSEDMEFAYRLFSHSNFCLIRDYHLFWYQGTDNLSFFRDGDNPEKVTFHKSHYVKTRKKQKELIRSLGEKRFKNPKACLKKLNEKISKDYWDISRVHRGDILKSIYFKIFRWGWKIRSLSSL